MIIAENGMSTVLETTSFIRSHIGEFEDLGRLLIFASAVCGVTGAGLIVLARSYKYC